MGSSPVIARIGYPLGAGLVTYLLAVAVVAITGNDGALTALWLGNGATVALLVSRPGRSWPTLLAASWLGAVLAGLSTTFTPPVALALASCNLLISGLAATFLRRSLGSAVPLSNILHLRALALCAGPGRHSPCRSRRCR